MKDHNGCIRPLAFILVILTLMLVGVQALAAQEVTRVIDDRNSFTVTSDSVRIEMSGVERTVSRDLWALASHPEHQHDVWDLRVLVARAEHRDGTIEAPAFGGSLTEALDELELLLTEAAAEIETLRMERDEALDELDAAQDMLTPLQAELDALRAEQRAALARIRSWIDGWR